MQVLDKLDLNDTTVQHVLLACTPPLPDSAMPQVESLFEHLFLLHNFIHHARKPALFHYHFEYAPIAGNQLGQRFGNSILSPMSLHPAVRAS